MADTLTPAQRSERMSRVRGKNTEPELLVRRVVHQLGFRFRLHCAALPGKPDLVFPRLKRVVFVHGCFWHGHAGCGRIPKSRLDFWGPKLQANKRRDSRNRRVLTRLGWRSLVVWECQLKNLPRVGRGIVKFLRQA